MMLMDNFFVDEKISFVDLASCNLGIKKDGLPKNKDLLAYKTMKVLIVGLFTKEAGLRDWMIWHLPGQIPIRDFRFHFRFAEDYANQATGAQVGPQSRLTAMADLIFTSSKW